MAQQLGTLAALPEGLISVPSSGDSQLLVPRCRGSSALFWP